MTIYALLWGIVILFYLVFLVRMRRMARESKEALRATEAMCDASEELYHWLEHNSYSRDIFVTAEFQDKVRKLIRAEKKFLDTYPRVDMDGAIHCSMEYITR
jgi:hypothetical protein